MRLQSLCPKADIVIFSDPGDFYFLQSFCYWAGKPLDSSVFALQFLVCVLHIILHGLQKCRKVCAETKKGKSGNI